MLIPSVDVFDMLDEASLSRRVNANSQLYHYTMRLLVKLIKKGEC